MKQPKKMTRRMKEKMSKKHLNYNDFKLLKVDEKEGTFTIAKKSNEKECITLYL